MTPEEERLDQSLGSLLESWYTRATGENCRFCNEHVGDVDADEKFCSETCEERFETVFEARQALGKRDLEQRGYD